MQFENANGSALTSRFLQKQQSDLIACTCYSSGGLLDIEYMRFQWPIPDRNTLRALVPVSRKMQLAGVSLGANSGFRGTHTHISLIVEIA
jgi:hypothetical protein